MSQKQQTELGDKIVGFYEFIDKALVVMKARSVETPLGGMIKKSLEIPNKDKSETPDLKFESAIHSDLANVEKLIPLLSHYEYRQLCDYQKMIEVEIDGLEGDMSPKAILMSTRGGAIFTGFTLAAFWFAFWSNIYVVEGSGEFLNAMKESLTNVALIELVLILIIWLGGTFGLISYAYMMFKNNRQANCLRSIKRAIALLLLISASAE